MQLYLSKWILLTFQWVLLYNNSTFCYLRYDGFDNQILYCLPNMNMVDVHAFHVTPKSFQTPKKQKRHV